MRSAHWLGHLEYDWEFPIFRHYLLRLAKDYTVAAAFVLLVCAWTFVP